MHGLGYAAIRFPMGTVSSILNVPQLQVLDVSDRYLMMVACMLRKWLRIMRRGPAERAVLLYRLDDPADFGSEWPYVF